MQFDPEHPSDDVLQEAARVIRAGGVVLHPTDTVYGLACNPLNPEPLERILHIKGRSAQKGFLVLIPDPGWVNEFAEGVTELFWEAAMEFWPGPVTLLARARPSAPPLLAGGDNKIGFRQPDLAFLQRWMEMIPGPIVSTSANLSDHPLASSPRELDELFAGKVDLFLEGGGIDPAAIPSTVVDLSQGKGLVLRRGAWVERIESFLSTSEDGVSTCGD